MLDFLSIRKFLCFFSTNQVISWYYAIKQATTYNVPNEMFEINSFINPLEPLKFTTVFWFDWLKYTDKNNADKRDLRIYIKENKNTEKSNYVMMCYGNPSRISQDGKTPVKK